MKSVQKIKKNRDFRHLYKHGKFYAEDFLVLYVAKNDLDWNRFGVSVSKKVGGAVIRNRVKRLFRENYRQVSPMLKKGYDFVITGRYKTRDASYDDIKRCMNSAFRRGKLFLTQDKKTQNHGVK